MKMTPTEPTGAPSQSAPTAGPNSQTASGGNANAPAQPANAQTGGTPSSQQQPDDPKSLYSRAYNEGREKAKAELAAERAEAERIKALEAEGLRKELAAANERLAKMTEAQKTRAEATINALPENLRSPAKKALDAGNIELALEFAETVKAIGGQVVPPPASSPHTALKPAPAGLDVEMVKVARAKAARGDAKELQELQRKYGDEAVALAH